MASTGIRSATTGDSKVSPSSSATTHLYVRRRRRLPTVGGVMTWRWPGRWQAGSSPLLREGCNLPHRRSRLEAKRPASDGVRSQPQAMESPRTGGLSTETRLPQTSCSPAWRTTSALRCGGMDWKLIDLCVPRSGPRSASSVQLSELFDLPAVADGSPSQRMCKRDRANYCSLTPKVPPSQAVTYSLGVTAILVLLIHSNIDCHWLHNLLRAGCML